MKLVLIEETQAAALRIPKGKGDGEVKPPWEELVPRQMLVPAQPTPEHVMTMRWPCWL